MNFSPIEVMALVVALLGAIKTIVIMINPQAWLKGVVAKVYGKPGVTMVVGLVLAAISLKYLLLAGITIVQIFAVMFFFMMLMLMSCSAYSKELFEFATKLMKQKNVLKKSWLALIIWIALTIWVLYTLFA